MSGNTAENGASMEALLADIVYVSILTNHALRLMMVGDKENSIKKSQEAEEALGSIVSTLKDRLNARTES